MVNADKRLDFVDCILLSYFKTNNIQVATFDKKLKKNEVGKTGVLGGKQLAASP